MIAYRYDENFMYVGVQPCQRDPIASAKAGKEIYLLPADCTYEAPPESKDGYNIVWNGEAWEYAEIPVKPEPETPKPPETHEPTVEEKLERLGSDYQKARFELGVYYMEAVLDGNIEVQEELQQELVVLKTQYDEDVASIEG